MVRVLRKILMSENDKPQKEAGEGDKPDSPPYRIVKFIIIIFAHKANLIKNRNKYHHCCQKMLNISYWMKS